MATFEYAYLTRYKCADTSQATHLSLVGGKFNIQSDFFYALYAKHHECGAYLVEKVRYPCRWYIDIDKLPYDIILNELKRILTTLGESCIVCMPKSSENQEHSGAHVIFTNVVVQSRDEASTLTKNLLSNSQLVSDISVYSSGLRMLGSMKKKNVCRVYYPVFTIDFGKLNEWPTNKPLDIETLKRASIFKPSFTKDHTLTAPTRDTAYHESGFHVDFDFSFIHPEYRHVRVSRIVQNNRNQFAVFTRNKYCMNIQREHKNQHIYFLIDVKNDAKMIYTRCLCRCAHTMCGTYRSSSNRIPLRLYYKLIS